MNLLAVLAVLNIVCLPIIFIIAMVKRKLWLLIPFLIIQLFWIIAGPEYLTYRAGGGFGPGTLVALASIILSLISLLIFLIGGSVVLPRFKEETNKIRWYLSYTIGTVFLCFVMGLPFAVSGKNTRQCDQLNRQEIEKIVEALNLYRLEQGDYPEDLEMLVPGYLPSLPIPHCFENYNNIKASKGFGESVATNGRLPRFVKCDNFVATPVITYGWLQSYDLETGEWSRISFLDLPECYYESLGR